jgi:hypothetical protein
MPCLPGCTACCVSPTAFHSKFKGHLKCPFHGNQGRCEVHPHRGLACRMHGLPVINHMGIQNLENCTIMDEDFLPKVSQSKAKGWLDQLLEINQNLVPNYGTEFHALVGLLIPCWLDLYFAAEVEDWLVLYQKAMWDFLGQPEESLSTSHTGIMEKFKMISLLQLSMDLGEIHSVKKILDNLENSFPATGSYYLDQIAFFRKEIKQMDLAS